MSIATDLNRIKTAKTAIREAINAKGGTLSDELIDQYATAIANLPSGGEDIDLSFITATANDILTGKIGADSNGNPVNGAIANANAPSVSGNTVTVYKGYQAEQTTVEISKATATLDKNTVTIPAGYHDENTLAVPEAPSPTVVGNTVTIHPGYVAEEQTVETEGGGMDFYKCAAVYGPRDVDIFVISGCPVEAANGTYMPTEYTTEDREGTKYPVYYNGTYYYCYDAYNWMNWGICTDYTTMLFIYSGSGTSWLDSDWNPVEGMSSVESKVTVDTDVPKTWDGYKAVAGGDGYTLETALTTGLTYGNGYKPIIGKIYSADATVAPVLKFALPAGAKVYASFAKNSATAETGQVITYPTDVSKYKFATIKGIPCINLSGAYGVGVAASLALDGDFTVASWVYSAAKPVYNIHWFHIGTETANGLSNSVSYQDCIITPGAGGSGKSTIKWQVVAKLWYHLAIVKQSEKLSLYVNGDLLTSIDWAGVTLTDNGVCVIGHNAMNNSLYATNRYQAAFRFYERALTDDEIFALANEFAPDDRAETY